MDDRVTMNTLCLILKTSISLPDYHLYLSVYKNRILQLSYPISDIGESF